MLAVAVALVAPITVRNARIYGELVPVSANGGIVLWEGIADAGGREFGARSRDLEVAAEEATRFGDPRYAKTLGDARRDQARPRPRPAKPRGHPRPSRVVRRVRRAPGGRGAGLGTATPRSSSRARPSSPRTPRS